MYLSLTDNYNHTSMHDNRRQLCTNQIKKIHIERLSPGGYEKGPYALRYNLDKEVDKERLHQNYLTFMLNSCSFTPHIKRDVADLKYVQSKSEYFKSDNSKMMIFIDLRQDRGYTGQLNPAVNGLDPIIQIDLKNSTIAPTSFVVLSVFPASIGLQANAQSHEYKYNPIGLKS